MEDQGDAVDCDIGQVSARPVVAFFSSTTSEFVRHVVDLIYVLSLFLVIIIVTLYSIIRMPSSSLFLRATAVLSALSSTALATKYDIQDTYAGETFLDGFDFFTAEDPTKGFVNYIGRTAADNADLIKMVGDDTYIGVDYKTTLNPTGNIGRDSVRIESIKKYTQGLFIVDLKHMPGSTYLHLCKRYSHL